MTQAPQTTSTEEPVVDAAPEAEARHDSPYTTKEKIGRLLWAIVQATIFQYSFHNWYGWRSMLLRMFGATIANDVVIRRTVKVECPWNLTMGKNSCLGDHVIAYCLGPITIGERVSVSQHAHLCAGTHDYKDPALPLLRPPIVIEDDVWIATQAFVGPNVTVGRGAILGARACAYKNCKPWMIYGGNPARAIIAREYHGDRD
ncbi:MAG: putative colanic acid biosynthesis acetyltransferase [Planctomycetota bacterium]